MTECASGRQHMVESGKKGKVYLIGAGPGDAGLLTLRGAEALSTADVVVFDYLSNQELLKHCPAGCERIYVGKKAGAHSMPQDDINRLLVEKAQGTRTVARLKGGDPFVFGRGGEEAQALAKNGIEFEIGPGITAATAVAAYAGIPLTHRGVSSSVALITGHAAAGKHDGSLDWRNASAGSDTLVFYMGVTNLASIVEALRRSGRPSTTPVALIRWGTLSFQKTVTGTLDTIVSLAREHEVKPPAIIVVGEVVALREEIRWFEKKPLHGRRIIVTRSRTQASALAGKLSSLGAEVVEFPTIDIAPLADLGDLDRALNEMQAFSWVVFASAHGARIFLERLFGTGRDSRALFGVKIAAIGSETGAVLRNAGLVPDLVPGAYASEALIDAFKALKKDYTGERVLLPCSEIARKHIPDELSKMGADVLLTPVYKNTCPAYSDADLDEVFRKKHDLATFTSSSTVSNLADILKRHDRSHYLGTMRGAAIGPTTAATMAETGIPVSVEAQEHTIAGLVQSILLFLERKT